MCEVLSTGFPEPFYPLIMILNVTSSMADPGFFKGEGGWLLKRGG